MSLIYRFNLQRKSGNKGLSAGNQMISANDRMHPMVKASITKYLREIASKINVEKQHIFSPENPCQATVKIYAPTRRRMDAPNWYPTIKALFDGFTDACLWTDDNNDVIKRTIFEYGGLSGSKQYTIEIKISNFKE